MGGPLRTSPEGLELIMGFEGFRARASRLPDGRWLIGYGHTRTARRGLTVTRTDAELVLRHVDLPPVETVIRDQVLTPLTQQEFDALVSFAWNIGAGAFRNSDVLACLNEGDRLGAAAAMWLWRKGRIGGEVKVVDALVRRRAGEIALFLTHPSGPAPVPGVLVRPMQDHDTGLSPTPAEPERTVIIEARAAPSSGSTLRPGAAPPPAPPPLSPQQAAARAVGERLARILGDLPPEPASLPEAAAEPGPSVEEITRAIADLAGPADAAAAVQPKGPPGGVERRRGLRPLADEIPDAAPLPLDPPLLPAEPGPDLPLPPAETYMVDDLAPAAIDEASLRRAIAENGHPPAHGNGAEALGRWLPFALLSGLGLVGLFAGVQRFIALAANAPVSETDVWLGPLLALGGGFLFVVATYYLYRAMTQQD